MSNTNTILLVVILLILVGGGVYWYTTYGPGAQKPAGVQINLGGSNQY